MPEAAAGAPAISRRHPVPDGELTYEPAERWVRGTIGDTTVVDSRHPVLVWEPGQAVPRYAFPVGEVLGEVLEPVAPPSSRAGIGATTWYDVTVGGRSHRHLAWRYGEGPLADHVAFDWFGRRAPGIEHWYEEDEEIFVHPRDPYKRVDPLPSSRHVQVSFGGRVLAETRRPVLLFETRLPIRYYIPPEDVDFSLLEATDLRTGCPYKGFARYWSVQVEGGDGSGQNPSGKNIVWSYPEPVRAASPIQGLVAFYNEVIDLTVDGVRLDRPVSEFNARLSGS